MWSGTPRTHRPGPGRVVPTSTYRLQLHAGFGFADAAAISPYLSELGVSHLYLSPILEPQPGSTHGYDVVDHDSLNSQAGGAAGFDALVSAAHAAGLGLIVDVVPNHMTVPQETYLNGPLWEVLRDGRDSAYADWFDVDWAAADSKLLMPILGAGLPEVLARGELTLARDGGVDGEEWVLRYGDHELPVRPGTEHLGMGELVAAQSYRLAHWVDGETDLNYRRFFDVTTLQAVRVEDDDVFDATHELLLDLFARGAIDGFRIDHPDGLADPGGYLARLAARTGHAWVVVEKILEGHEELRPEWATAGTTGYDALLRVQQVLTDPTGSEILDDLWAEVAGPQRHELAEVIVAAKLQVVEETQAAEVNRLLRLIERVLPRVDPAAARRGLEALLVSMDRYRAYLVPGYRPARSQLVVLAQAEGRARTRLASADHPALAQVTQLARGGRPAGALDGADARAAADEFVTRFQQTCGPVMAKGVEDTAFYRWLRLAGANEVGGDPGTLSIEIDEFHAYAHERLATWPLTMTTLTTHDTKRSEDVRARLAVLSERAADWRAWLDTARRLGDRLRPERLDAVTEYLIWQTLVGAWPITADRMTTYLLKAVREAKVHTAWVDGDPAYEDAVLAFATALTRDAGIAAHVGTWIAQTEPSERANSLGQKLIQLTMPGVPDVYQGSELPLHTLVDPDNRGPVDYADRALRLAAIAQSAGLPADLGDAKLQVTACALQLRRAHPHWFVGPEAQYAAIDTGSPHALAFGRGSAGGIEAITVATIAPHRLAGAGGWADERIELPDGEWVDLLSRRPIASSGGARIGSVLGPGPVALLVRRDTARALRRPATLAQRQGKLARHQGK